MLAHRVSTVSTKTRLSTAHLGSRQRKVLWGAGTGDAMPTLTPVTVRNAGDGKLHDGGVLILVKHGAAGKWLYRFTHLG